jgi:hypothetical protein
MIAVALLAVPIAAVRLATDPMERFHRRTGLRRPGRAGVITSGGISGGTVFRLAFDADPRAIVEWLSKRLAEDWRGWHGGRVPDWIIGLDPFARPFFASVPIDDPDSSAVRFAFRDSPAENHPSDLIVIDTTIGRVWFCSWGH